MLSKTIINQHYIDENAIIKRGVDLDTEKARVYLTALKEGSFKAAADRLGYTTSGISRSIASLEEEAGVQLFIRDRKGVKPSREAAEFIPIFEKLVFQAQLFQDTANKMRGLEAGSITIGVSYSLFYRLLANQIKEFTEMYPNIDIRTVQKTSSELLTLMEAHEIDFAIMTKRESRFEFHKLLDDPMVACISKKNPLSKADVFPLFKFAEEPMAVAFPDIETDYRNALEKYGISPNICYSTSDVYAAYCMVEADLGVSLSNKLEVSNFSGDVALLKTEPPINLEIGIMQNSSNNMTVAAKRFLSFILEENNRA